MSYILDALNKSEEKRRNNTGGDQNPPEVRVPPKIPESVMDLNRGRGRNWMFIAGGVLLLCGGLAGGYFLSQMGATSNSPDDGVGKQAVADTGPVGGQPANVQQPVTPLSPPKTVQQVPPAEPPKTVESQKIDPPISNPEQVSKDARTKVARLRSPTDHFNAAWEAVDQGFYGKAIAQFNAAIEWEPAMADAYFGRAWAKEKAGMTKDALNDYSKTIDLRPDHFQAFFSRGVLRHQLADYSNSARDFDVSFKRATGEMRVYSALWRYVARRRAGGDATAELEADLPAIDVQTWPGVMAAFFLGLATEADVMSHIRVRKAEEKPGLRCIALFFVGVFRLMDGDTDLAKEAFAGAIDTNAKDFRQYEAARNELWRLEHPQ